MDRSVKEPGEGLAEYKELVAVAGLGAVTEAAGLSLRVGEVFGGPDQDVPWNPVNLIAQLGFGDLAWTTEATAGAGALAAGAALGAVGSVWAWRAACAKCDELRSRHRTRRERVDGQAKFMARGPELGDMGRKAMRAKAAQLKVTLGAQQAPGVSIGESIFSGQMLYASYEDLHLDIWGPRAGKTTARVIPAIMEAVGPVVATSNKRDVVDATRDPRAARGGRTWIFDPQNVAGEVPTWYWDPIEWVAGTDGGAGAQERAAQLAGHFAAAGDADQRDAFFDPEGEDLLAGLFLAAAVGKHSIGQVFEWVTKPRDLEPVNLLGRHGGYRLVAAALADQYNAPDKQRAGVFSTAKKMSACLKYDAIQPWVSPAEGGATQRELFDVEAFATSQDTLYPLSREGKGNAGPLVTALTAAVVGAAAEEGTRRGGRLPVPMLAVLDEAANIVKWAELPKQYSHFGSRGIVVMTILQSWAQGVRCWSSDGMTALWSAANVRVLGAGLADAGFLRDISELVGEHYEQSKSVSRGQGGTSKSMSLKTEKTLTASDLAALPRGRALVFVSGHRAALVRTVPWERRAYADDVRASLTAHDPATAPAEHGAAATKPRLRIVPPPADDTGDEQEGKSA